MRKMGFAIGAIAVGLTALSPVPANADTAGCVTRSEFRKVDKGMTQERVRGIFDTNGRSTVIQTDPVTGVKRTKRLYITCGSGLTVRFAEVRYVKRSDSWRVSGKSW